MHERILAIATEPSLPLYPALTSVRGMYPIDFLTTPRSPFHEASAARTLTAAGVSVHMRENPARQLRRLLRAHSFPFVFLFVRDSSCLRALARDIRAYSPSSRIVLFLDTLHLFSGRNAALWPRIGDLWTNRRAAYAQFDLIVAGSERDRKELLAGSPDLPVAVIDWKKKKDAGKKLREAIGAIPGERRGGLVSIVVLNCNQKAYTKRCLNSVRAHTDFPYELILVDNGSSDGTVDYLRTVPGATLIRNAKNLGFAAGCNRGIRASRGDYVLLLNNDTVVTPGWLSTMVRCARSVASAGLVGPRTNVTFGIQQLEGCAYRGLREMRAWADVFRLSNAGNWFEVFWLTGFCLLIKREVIDAVGLLDERYGLGTFEDHDYCLRAMRKGFKLLCAGDVFVHHYGTRSYTRKTIIRLNENNRKLFIKKWGERTYEFLLESLFYSSLGMPENR